MDLTFEVMLPPRGTTDWSVSCNPEFRILSPICVYPRMTATVIGMRCTGYIHCADVPEHPSWPQSWTVEDKVAFMNQVLARAWEDDTFNMVEQRQWGGDANVLSNPQRNALLNNRQVVLPWNTLRNLWQDKKNNRGLTTDDFIYTPPA